MDGLIPWPNDRGVDGAALISFIVKNGDVWDTLGAPTMSEIEEKCEEYGLPVEPLKEQMRVYPECHTFFIDAEKYRAANPKE